MHSLDVILELIRASILRRGLPVPAPRDVIYRWAGPTSLPKRGRIHLYTGGLYQLAPYIKASVELLAKMSSLGPLRHALRFYIPLAGRLPDHILIRPSRREVIRSQLIVRNIARALSKTVEGLAYLHEEDLYSGVIAHDYGIEDAFGIQAERVWRAFKKNNVKRVVTIDPHTTRVLRDAYPRYVDGFDVEVKNYLEILGSSDYSASIPEGEAVIHDPCLYARFEGIIDQPRELLRRGGVDVKEPVRSRKLTYCCGGPIEGLAPALSKKIARVRSEELLQVSKVIVTLCPICMNNLEPIVGARGRVVDIGELLTGKPEN